MPARFPNMPLPSSPGRAPSRAPSSVPVGPVTPNGKDPNTAGNNPSPMPTPITK